MRIGGPSDRRWLAPAAIVVLALLLRIAAIAVDSGYEPGNDAFEYDYYARSVAAGDGYPQSGYLLQGGPTAIRGPAYPYLLGAVYAVSDDSVALGRLAGAALGALSVLLLYLIAKRVWGRRVGLVAMAMGAVFPPLVLVSRDLVSESLFIPLELGAVLCVLNFRRSGGELRWALASGALCGLAALTRNTGLALILPVAIGLWPKRSGPWRSPLTPVLAIACAAIVIAPWIARDAVEFGRFVPITTSGGIATAGTYNEDSFRDASTHGAWRDPQIVPAFAPLFTTPGIDEATTDVKLRHAAQDFAWQHPDYVAETTAWNLLRLFEVAGGSVVDARGKPVEDRGIGSADPTVERIGIAVAVALAIVGALGIVRSRRKGELPSDGEGWIPNGPPYLWLVPILMLAVAAPVAGLPRYRLPADPFLLILAAIGLVWLWDRRPELRIENA